MKKFIALLVLATLSLSCYSQEPGCNIGKSLSTMKQLFPELRYIKTDSKGDEYEDGYPEEGIGIFFYFKNGYVIEECLICKSDDKFPLVWFNSMAESFNKKYSHALRRNAKYDKEYVFSNFSVYLIFVSERGTNTALIVYKANNSN